MKKEIVKTNKQIIDSRIIYETIDYVPGKNNKELKSTNVGKMFHAVVFYIDMRSSTILVEENKNKNVGRTHKAYFNTIVNCIEFFQGEVRSINGDSVLAFFAKGTVIDKCNNAISAAANINFLLNSSDESLNKLIKKYGISIDYGIGITMGNIQCVAVGNESYNEYKDKMWVATEINFSAKMADSCSLPENIIISKQVKENTSMQKFSNDKDIWRQVNHKDAGVVYAGNLSIDTID